VDANEIPQGNKAAYRDVSLEASQRTGFPYRSAIFEERTAGTIRSVSGLDRRDAPFRNWYRPPEICAGKE
jgi:hypothetical protein